ncbi:MAG: hypothetical protein Q9227_001446 [Pyrenula ochraceoflavens]
MARRYDDCPHSDDREVPSLMKYDMDSRRLDPVRWGYSVEHDRTRNSRPSRWQKVSFPKLLLSSQAETERFLQPARAVGDIIQKDGVSLVADYLQKLVAKLNSELRDRFPRHAHAERFYYCGYPPAWPDEDVQKLSDACKEAGMTNVQMVSEPTAAATTLLSNMSKMELQAHGLRQGETFLLIDAGGMTVEFAVLRILSLDPFAVEQVTIGKGDYCGSGYCNLRFRDWVMEHQEVKRLDDENREKVADFAANNEFEFHIKRNLKPDDVADQEYSIHLPTHLFPELKQHAVKGWSIVPELNVTRRQVVEDFMERSFNDIIKLALEELDNAQSKGMQTSKVFLTGGFGKNALLQHRIREALRTRCKDPEIIQPDQETGAVAQGIIKMAFNQSAIKKSRIRYSIGIDEKELYDFDKHEKGANPVNTFLNQDNENIVESIRWLLKKGDEIKFNEPMKFLQEADVDLDGKWIFRTEIITSTKTSEDNLDRLGGVIDDLDARSDSDYIRYHVRDDCWSYDDLEVNLKGLSENEMRAYLELKSEKKRKGSLLYNIELTIHHDDQFEFWMVPVHGPPTKWKMGSFDPNEYDPFRQDELAFPGQGKDPKLGESYRPATPERERIITENVRMNRLKRPRRKINLLTKLRPVPKDIFSPPSSPEPESAEASMSTLTRQITPRKRTAASRQRPNSPKSPRLERFSPNERRVMSRSPTVQPLNENVSLGGNAPIDNSSMTYTNPSTDADALDETPQKRRLKTTARCSGRGGKRLPARGSHASSQQLPVRSVTASSASSSARYSSESPPHNSIPNETPDITSSQSSINAWVNSRTPRKAASRVTNYRIPTLEEMEARDA